MVSQPIIISSVAPNLEKFHFLQYIRKCSNFRSVFLKIDQRPQTNFDLQKFIIPCYQTEDIRNVIKLHNFFVIRFERCSK